MRVLTGGAGFVGANLRVALARRHPGWEIVAFDNLKRRGSELNLPRLREAGVRFVHGDVREPEDLLALDEIDALVECSAEPSALAGIGRQTPRTRCRTNLLGAYHCLELARRDRAQFVFLSTSRVYPFAALDALAYRGDATPLRAGRRAGGARRVPAGCRRGLPARRARAPSTARPSWPPSCWSTEYAAAFGLRTVDRPLRRDRRAVADGQGRPGRVHLLAAAPTTSGSDLRYIGYGGARQAGARPAPRRRPGRPDRRAARAPRSAGRRRRSNVGGGREASLSLRETTELCRELTGNSVPVEQPAETAPRRRAHLPVRLRAAVRRAPTGARARRRATILADILDWIADNERAVRHGPDWIARTCRRDRHRARAAWSARRPSSTSSRAGYDVIGLENDMRARFFGPDASTAPVDRAARASYREFRSLDVDIRDADGGRARLRRARAARSSWSSTPPRSRRTTGPPRDPQTDFAVNANGTLNLLEATRRHAPDAPFIFTVDQQGLRRHAEPPAARSSSRRGWELPEDHRYFDGIDTSMSIDHSHALAVRRLEGRRRPAGAGVRPLLRHADRLLPRRLPDRPEPRRRRAARLPRLPDALHGHRRAVHGLRLRAASRCATTSTAPTWCARSTRSTRAPRAAAVYNIGGGRAQQLLDARGDRAVRADRRARARLGR